MSTGSSCFWAWSPRQRRAFAKGIMFILPWLIGLVVFIAYPIASSLYYSLTDYDILTPPKFVGVQNYARMFLRDPYLGKVLYNTVYFVLVGMPLTLATAFALALLLNTDIRLRSLFRTLFYIPSVVPAVASAMIWLFIFNVQYGVVNSVLASVGLWAIPFLSSQALVKPSLILISCWASGTTMIIFLAALQDVPRSLFDAARVDGAGTWRRFWHITLPMCTPSVLFNMITGMIGAFQYFTFAWLLTRGGPNRASTFYALYLYERAFVQLDMGYASALAWLLFLLVAISTWLLFRTSGRWVYYGGE